MVSRTLQHLKSENSLLLRSEIERGATVLRGLPEIVTLNSTDICNLRCVMCPRNLAQGKYRLEDRVLEYVCRELFPTALKANLTTAGGEPLGPGFELILEAARSNEVKIDIVTNGMLLTRRTFERMHPILDHLNVSVDCSIPEVYERLRLGGSFERLLENLAAVREARASGDDDMLFSMSAVVMASNLPYLPELVRFAAEHGALAVILQRLRHEIKPTWEEEVTRHFSAEEIETHLGRAVDAARESGICLFQAELGRENHLFRPLRSKVPETLDGRGVCYFLSQSFSVMYTGEVYPCCKPTDYKLGDVRYQSPLEIWNGKPLRRLREAHHSRRGTLFCSGCEYAPHLPARSAPRRDEALRLGRRAWAHVANGATRWVQERAVPRVFDPPPPPHERIQGCIEPLAEPGPSSNGSGRGPRLAGVRLEGRREASAVDPRDGSLWFVSDAALHRSPTPEAAPEPVARLDQPVSGEAACLFPLAPGEFLLSFEGSGRLLRVRAEHGRLAVETALALSDERSWVRREGVARSADGTLWVGEYGSFPGARCAHVYRSDDGGTTFAHRQHFARASHVHVVACVPGSRRVIVTTGDLARERATYVGSGGGFRAAFRPWAGFTAVAFSDGLVHFGTDLPGGNGLLRVPRRLRDGLEFRALEGALDLQVRQIALLGDGRLIALGCLDENLVEQRASRRAVLLSSADDGGTWRCVHRFAADWSDAPERFLVLDGAPRIVTDCTSVPWLLELP